MFSSKDFVRLKPKQIKVSYKSSVKSSVLFYGDKALTKKSKDGNLDVPQVSYDGADVSELMGINIISKINIIIQIGYHGICRDDDGTGYWNKVRKWLHQEKATQDV